MCWLVILPFEGSEFPSNAVPGEMKIFASAQPQGEFGQANFTDDGGVTHGLKWDLELEIDEPKSLPSLDTISMQVYADFKSLEFVPYKTLNDRQRDTKFARLSFAAPVTSFGTAKNAVDRKEATTGHLNLC